MGSNTKSPFALKSLLFGVVCTTIISLLSCNNGKDSGVYIPIPTDTSALGRINHFIPQSEIEKYKKDFSAQRDSLSRLRPNLFIPLSEAFNKGALIDILKDPKCVGIKVYYGLKPGDKQNSMRLILVGLDEQGNDLYFQKGSAVAAQITGADLGGAEYGHCLPPCPAQ